MTMMDVAWALFVKEMILGSLAAIVATIDGINVTFKCVVNIVSFCMEATRVLNLRVKLYYIDKCV